MGKIKSKTIKRTSNTLMDQGVEFSEEFESNKKILKDTMPSKKIRNRMAGYLSRLVKQQNKKKQEMQ